MSDRITNVILRIAILSAMKFLSLFTLAAILALPMASMAAPSSEAITFAVDQKRTFLPLEEAANHLAWTPTIDDKRGKIILNGTTISTKFLRTFTDGTNLISLADLAKAGAEVTGEEDGSVTKVAIKDRYFNVVKREKRAEINLAQQKLRAWEGQRLVLETRVSSGKRGRTPSGDYSAGPYKARKHYSSRYNNAYMPYSVQVTGHIFIHGYKSVPEVPRFARLRAGPLPHRWKSGPLLLRVDQQGHSHQDRTQVARCSADDLSKHLATDIGELANPSGMPIGQLFVVQAHQVENRAIDIANLNPLPQLIAGCIHRWPPP